jgi:hypothetical protein
MDRRFTAAALLVLLANVLPLDVGPATAAAQPHPDSFQTAEAFAPDHSSAEPLFLDKHGLAATWPIVDGAIVSTRPTRDGRGNHIVSAWHFRDADVHGKLVQDGTTFGEPRSTYHPLRDHTTRLTFDHLPACGLASHREFKNGRVA